jgi:hypothetical protein
LTRTTQQEDIYQSIKGDIPPFEIIGPQSVIDKMVLWEFSKRVNNNQHFETFRQITGSCVGNGGGQATWYLSAMENVRLGQNIECKLPFYLLPSGRSRYFAGYRRAGSGSSGAAFAKAISTEGILPFDAIGLPPAQHDGGITWGQDAEYQWSDGDSIPSKFIELGKQNLVKSAAQVNNSQDVWNALANGYPCTIASNWGGQMQPKAAGSPAVLLSRRVTVWQHQMCVIGIWNHPTLGRIFCILNSWGPAIHGKPVDDSPPGSFWVLEDDIDYIVRQGDSFAFSQFDGFPAQMPNYWLL